MFLNYCLIDNANQESWNFPKITADYLNVKKPELEPTIFYPSDVILNLFLPHGGIAFSANNKDVFWTRNSASMGSKLWCMRN